MTDYSEIVPGKLVDGPALQTPESNADELLQQRPTSSAKHQKWDKLFIRVKPRDADSE